jgi:prevent-host-death family protein
MDVSVSQLRAELARHLRAAQDGEEVIITDRGVPVARLGPAAERKHIDDLIRDGIVDPPSRSGPRPRATGRPRVKSRGLVSDLVAEQRD